MDNSNFMNINATGSDAFTVRAPYYDIGVPILTIKKDYFVETKVTHKLQYKLDEHIYETFKSYYNDLFDHRLLMNIIYMINRDDGLVHASDFIVDESFFLPNDDEEIFEKFKEKISTVLKRNVPINIVDERFVG